MLNYYVTVNLEMFRESKWNLESSHSVMLIFILLPLDTISMRCQRLLNAATSNVNKSYVYTKKFIIYFFLFCKNPWRANG